MLRRARGAARALARYRDGLARASPRPSTSYHLASRRIERETVRRNPEVKTFSSEKTPRASVSRAANGRPIAKSAKTEDVVAFEARLAVKMDHIWFRTYNRVLKRDAEAAWGLTMRERWRRTFMDGEAYAVVYWHKFSVVKTFWDIGGWPFGGVLVIGAACAWTVASALTSLGIVGFVVVGKMLGVGDQAISVIEFVAGGWERWTGTEAKHMVTALTVLVTYRTSYYTLPVILFTYEELYQFAMRFRTLVRWLR